MMLMCACARATVPSSGATEGARGEGEVAIEAAKSGNVAATGVTVASSVPEVSFVSAAGEQRVSPGQACHDTVVAQVLDILTRADEKLKIVVSADLVREQMQQGSAVRLVFATPRLVRNVAFDRSIPLREAVVPLSGRFGEGRSVVFFADPEYGDGNQFVWLDGGAARRALEACRP